MRRFWFIVLIGLLPACTAPRQPDPGNTAASQSSAVSSVAAADSSVSRVELVAENLAIPWDIAFLPNGDMLVTERPGTLQHIRAADRVRHPVEGVHHIGEGGLLGIALHPDFEENGWLYLYLTTENNGLVTNRVDRYVYRDAQLTDRLTILEDIPGARYHDGGEMVFGPDGYLYITTGDAGNGGNAQNTASLAGKILRVADDGSIPPDNPFDNAVYSYGHRNPQGLAWDEQGRLWSTEHGRSGIRSGYDEVNRIQRGHNYGWPDYQGDETAEGITPPVLHSGPTTTWAPASAAYRNGSLFFGGLRGQTLYEMEVPQTPEDAPVLHRHLADEYGRLRAVVFGPDGSLYFTTSNTDGRGTPAENDDRILRIRYK